MLRVAAGALLALSLLPSFRVPSDPDGRTPATARARVEGQVLRPDGAPAAGALVTTSAGGRTHADAEGRYELELEHALDAAELRLVALAPPDLSASASVPLSSAGGRHLARPLRLEAGLGCSPDWLPLQEHGIDLGVGCLLVHDDGTGPALYASGRLDNGGGNQWPGIARWDGLSWTWGPLAYSTYPIAAMISHDDGGGARIYIAQGATVRRLDGSTWTTIGVFQTVGVRAFAVYDAGAGPELYAGGYFSSIDGAPAFGLARWDGASWTEVGGGLRKDSSSPWVYAMHVHDDGSGPALFVGGSFDLAGATPVDDVARWNGASWSDLDGGTNGGLDTGSVEDFATFDDGSGPHLYAAGSFKSLPGGLLFNTVARWDGSSWSALGSGTPGNVKELVVYKDALNQPALYAAGEFTAGDPTIRLGRWDGAAWSFFSGATDALPRAMLVHDDGTPGGPLLFIAGDFEELCGRPARSIAKCDATEVFAVTNGPSWSVSALALFDDGRGTALYVGGNFTAGPLESIGRFDGAAWEPLGAGIGGTVQTMVVHDDGGGPALYVGGDFLTAGGVTATRVARWDGASWSAVGGGMDNLVRDLLVHDDGTGPALYAAGWFTTAGGVSAPHVAKWDGVAWSSVGGGTNGILAGHALCTFDDGGGPDLYLGGTFTAAGGVLAKRVARWDGTAWSAVGSGFDDGAVWALHVHDDGLGGGPALYAGGVFTSAGGVAANKVARWDGASWSGLGGGFNDGVQTLESYDDGTGAPPALYAGGKFLTAGGVAVNGIARWDGASWSPLGAGLEANFPVSPARVNDLLVHDDGGGDGATLHIGGHFTYSPAGDSFLATWGGCAQAPPPACTGGISFGLDVMSLSACGHVSEFYAVATGGATQGGTWQIEYGPGFPLDDGWSVELYPPTDPQFAHVVFGAVGSSTTGSWPIELTWTTTCDGQPLTLSKTIQCELTTPYLGLGEPYCFGDGTDAACPCANGVFGCNGCANSTGLGAELTASGSTSVAAGDLLLHGSRAAPGQAGLFFQGTQRASGGEGLPFGDGLRCAGGAIVRLQVRTANGAGASTTTVDVAATGNVSAGDTRTYQLWYRDPNGSPCGTGFNFSNGLELVWEP